jgi:FdhD protein
MAGKESSYDIIGTAGCLSFSRGAIHEQVQEVCTEEIVVITLNGKPITTQVATPIQLRELGAGFIISQGLARSISSVHVDGLTINVEASREIASLSTFIESSGGSASDTLLGRVESDLVITCNDIFFVISSIVSDLWEKTGGAHCSVLFSHGEILAKSTDIGRHNTVDKIIGHAVLTGIDLSQCVLGCTGRQPLGMITKAANAGIPIVVSKAATTSSGIEQADRAGITLVCRVKEASFSVYTNVHRIAGFGKASRP